MLLLGGCDAARTSQTTRFRRTQEQLFAQLDSPALTGETRYAVVNQLATNMLSAKDYTSLVPFLTGWVEQHPDDPYDAYWLLMTAHAYLENDAEPVAAYYLERILRNYDDLLVQGTSVHYLCLKNLIQISTEPANRITYFNQLINRFPNDVSSTELYLRMAREYQNEGEWTQALRAYKQFLAQEDAATIQIADMPNAFLTTRQLMDFNDSSKDWTFETLDALVAAVKAAIASYSPATLDRYKAKVNFFAMSWPTDETAENARQEFSLRSYMRGNKISCAATLDESSGPTEAYLRTWGWSTYMDVWYFYFRKVNFPLDPDIHGRWEWAGIYYGEKM